jgi:outer membrane receptor protein involved in Fe transport
MVKANLRGPLAGGRLWAGADAQYMSARRTLAGAGTPGFLLANLTLLAPKLPGGIEASAGAYNAFDARHADPASGEHTQDTIVQNGRNLAVKLSWRF